VHVWCILHLNPCSFQVKGSEEVWVPIKANYDEIVVQGGLLIDTGHTFMIVELRLCIPYSLLIVLFLCAADMLQNLTNGLFRSTTHRVVNPDDEEVR
jgi:hypothetical protein